MERSDRHWMWIKENEKTRKVADFGIVPLYNVGNKSTIKIGNNLHS